MIPRFFRLKWIILCVAENSGYQPFPKMHKQLRNLPNCICICRNYRHIRKSQGNFDFFLFNLRSTNFEEVANVTFLALKKTMSKYTNLCRNYPGISGNSRFPQLSATSGMLIIVNQWIAILCNNCPLFLMFNDAKQHSC